eukprot:scaffold1335_cov70-Cylindrotheca_fusiformis.AAC.1
MALIVVNAKQALLKDNKEDENADATVAVLQSMLFLSVLSVELGQEMSGTIDKIVLGDNNNIIKTMMLDKMTTIFQFEVKTIGVFPALCKLVLAGRIVSSIKQLWDYIRKTVWLKIRCCKFGLWT